MAENEYFKKALADFTFDAASGGAIRHLADLGYTVKQIAKKLDFAVPEEKVGQAVWDHLVERQQILLEEPGSGAPKEQAVFVEERGKFGKKSFRRVVFGNDGPGRIHWVKKRVDVGCSEEMMRFLAGKCLENGRDTAYMACDFGIWEHGGPKQNPEWTNVLEERQKEYVTGLPWIKKRVYHRLDRRMEEIAGRLVWTEEFEGVFYFGRLGEQAEILFSRSTGYSGTPPPNMFTAPYSFEQSKASI